MGNVTAQTRTGKPPAMDGRDRSATLDIVYVVRPGAENESLRYSLRSLTNLAHGKVYISGGMPPWCRDVYHIIKEVDQELPDQEDSNLNLLLAALDPDLSENFILMNDDFFIMQKGDLPFMHQGPLQARIDQYRVGNRYHQAYSLIRTQGVLADLGIPPEEQLSYELHIPMVMNKANVIHMFNVWKETGLELFALRPRTMYGNLYKINGVNTQDAKETADPKARFLSTGVDFDISLTGDIVRAKFRNKGAYE